MVLRSEYNKDHPVISFRIPKGTLSTLKIEARIHGFEDVASYVRHLLTVESQRIRAGPIKRLRIHP
ncbi:MAG: hypothetical protein ACYDBK_02525 [Thermoplasmataceae archaeon]